MPKAATRDPAGLEIDAPLRYQRRTWVVQRLGWGVFLLLIVAALAGLFGAGPLSGTTLGSPAEGLQITYDRFARLHAPTAIEIRADRRLARDGELAIMLTGDAARGLQLQAITPPADGTGLVPGGIVLRFAAEESAGTLAVVLHAKPERTGTLTSRVAIAGGPAHTISQWIYP